MNSSPPLPQRPRTQSSIIRPTFKFPEPEFNNNVVDDSNYPSAAFLSPVRPLSIKRRIAKSDANSRDAPAFPTPEFVGAYDDDYTPIIQPITPKVHRTEISRLSLESDECLRRFQAGELASADDEWYQLVPAAARESLGKKEVNRQSGLFELFKAERDYVNDMEAVMELFIEPLRASGMPYVDEIIEDVFGNMAEILSHHKRMLKKLFARQLEQHPLVQSVADIILDEAFVFSSAYDTYIKHYPLAAAYHNTNLRNKKYAELANTFAEDPRTRKRELTTFLARPVTRLPRLSLLLSTILGDTDSSHPDTEAIPLLRQVLSDAVRNAQPGIAAAEARAKCWELDERLVFQRGEIIDLDLYEPTRSLIFSGILARKQRGESGWLGGWVDVHVWLLDNYFLMTKEEKRQDDTVVYHLVSRPIPLEFLRIASLDAPSEPRKSGILDTFRSATQPEFPITIYHAADRAVRSYTLYAPTEAARTKWADSLNNALVVGKAESEGNMWFAEVTLSERAFRVSATGPVTAAAPFVLDGRRYLAVGCANGIFVALFGSPDFTLVLPQQTATRFIIFPSTNTIVIQAAEGLHVYALSRLVNGVQRDNTQTSLAMAGATQTRIGAGENILFARAAHVQGRNMLIYASKGLIQGSLRTFEVVPHTGAAARHASVPAPSIFRPFGEPMNVGKDVRDAMPLTRTIAVCGDRNLAIVDPTSLGKATIATIPDFTGASSDSNVGILKARVEGCRTLGVTQSFQGELLVIYDDLGYYITKTGAPARRAKFIRWEAKAESFAIRGQHLLLFSPGFVEIRLVTTGRLVQVIEGSLIRLLHQGGKAALDDTVDGSTILVQRVEGETMVERVLELIETSEIGAAPAVERAAMWDSWDM